MNVCCALHNICILYNVEQPRWRNMNMKNHTLRLHLRPLTSLQTCFICTKYEKRHKKQFNVKFEITFYFKNLLNTSAVDFLSRSHHKLNHYLKLRQFAVCSLFLHSLFEKVTSLLFLLQNSLMNLCHLHFCLLSDCYAANE